MDGFVLEHFPVSCSTEEECEDYLIRLRWADGFHCPKCDHEGFYKIKTRKLFECRECRAQVSITTGTVMHNSKLSLMMWFRVIHLLVSSDKEWTASTLAEHLRINYRTARLMLNKLKWALEKKAKFSASRKETPLKEHALPESDNEQVECSTGSNGGNGGNEGIEGKQASEKGQQLAELIYKLNEKCAVLQKEKQRMNKMSRAICTSLGLRGNSPSVLVGTWMKTILSVYLCPGLMR